MFGRATIRLGIGPHSSCFRCITAEEFKVAVLVIFETVV